MTTPAKERIGIVGVGRTGLAMAEHLIKAGYPVMANDIDQNQLRKARAAGAETVASAKEIGATADFVILGVGYDDEVKAVVYEPGGLLDAMHPGTIIAVSSTVSPDTVTALQAHTREKGIGVFGAPIARGRFAADQGTLLALVGGAPDVVARARPIYHCFCSDIAHLGGVGAGQIGKAINNFLLWVSGVALIEAGRLSEAVGMDLVTLREALLVSSGASDALKNWDNVSFRWALKDMQIVNEMADKTGLSLPMAGAVKELVKDARRIKSNDPAPWTRQKSAG
jgi:3-hydroxyisobutyrate dehydrogenase-like beta-hydroxyacid dehydrogenase